MGIYLFCAKHLPANDLKTARPPNWCVHCEQMGNSTFADATVVQSVNENFIPVHLDLDKNKRIAEILEVDRIPCTIALSPRADLLGRIVGVVNTEQYSNTLARIRTLQARVERKLAAQPY